MMLEIAATVYGLANLTGAVVLVRTRHRGPWRRRDARALILILTVGVPLGLLLLLLEVTLGVGRWWRRWVKIP